MLGEITLFAVLVCSVRCFNLEGRLPLYKRGLVGSTFGFSVAMHKTTSGNNPTLKQSLLVIGSPTADALPQQGDTIKPGGIYYCPVTTNSEDCDRVKMDEGDSAKNNNKSGQWLGVSLKSQGAGKHMIACAHRYSQSFNTGRNEFARLCGKCFLLNGTSDNTITEITPEETNFRFIASPCDRVVNAELINRKNGLGYSQSGVSLSFVNDEYVSGAPGMWAWSGGMFDFDLASLDSVAFAAFVENTDMVLTRGCRPREFVETKSAKCEGIPLRRDAYIGFSVATSNAFTPGTNETTYIAGAPRGNITGAVLLYQKITDVAGKVLAPKLNGVIMGPAMGSSFGFSVAAADLNGDGLDDLIVGAPQYYQYNNEGKYGGAVYIYINSGTMSFDEVKPQSFYGPLDSFFGYSVAAIGDIDQDGFNDFAVGSPYEKPSGKLHIFRGSSDGIVKKAQTLHGENYNPVNTVTKGFGISMSGMVDIDNNLYPDLLVGTLADFAVLFRSRPVITVKSSLVVTPETMDLRKPNCTDDNGKMVSCFDIKFCFTYTSTHNEYTEDVGIIYTLGLDSDHTGHNKIARAQMQNGTSTVTSNLTLSRAGVKICPEGTVRSFFSQNAKDRFNPIKVDIEFNLASSGMPIKPELPDQPIFNMINDPIMNADYPRKLSALVSLANDCGSDGCQSDLRINGTLPPEVLVGGSGKIRMIIDVANKGEEAHQAFVSARLPPRVFFDNFTILESSGAKIECYTEDTGGTSSILCGLGNPYIGGSRDKIGIELDVASMDAFTTNITIELNGRTTSINPDIPPVPLVSKVIVELKLSLTSFAQPQQVRYTNSPILGESAIQYTDQIGPFVEYTFNINNEGDYPANDIHLNVHFPIEINNGKWLLYLVSTNVLAGASTLAGECSGQDVNPLQYRLRTVGDTRKKRELPSGLREPHTLAYTTPAGSSRSLLKLECGSGAKCTKIKCKLEPLQPFSSTSVTFKARLWNYTFLEEYKKVDLVKIFTKGHLKSGQANVRIVGEKTSRKVTTTVDHAFFKEDVASLFPWWYILIGILLALIFYIIIIWLLVKCGFFKRKKYPRQPQQPDEFVLTDEKNDHDMTESTA